ncbi:ATR-interacting protein isoform X1 [Calypte anna]|uniref:ATR-interacting protein isoform X1 n=1 Tax=Calypte anna TaxID=9244 RepID=UPI0011C4837B|nr:ATR-interacting protein isoform X1 [Calypte anna]
MAAQPPLGPRKRSGPALCGTGWAGAASGCSGALANGFPPIKRPKSSGATEPGEGPGDPFGDGDDFTADDLEEIDILASQALSQEAAGGVVPRTGPPGRAWDPSSSERGEAAGRPPGSTPAPAGRRKGMAPGDQPWRLASAGAVPGSSTADSLIRDAFQFEVLQTQHEEIKQKLKEMQDEILTKNGEIKVLRDSMQQMEFAMEEQKRSYVLLEQQKSQTLSEKEKEFSKKLLSLQSELQFKDAEMNELRARLQNCERNKHGTQTVLMSSPKKNSVIQVKSEVCSPQPGKRSFPTKESFSAEMSARPSCAGNLITPITSIKEDSKMTHPEILALKHKEMAKNGSYSSSHKRNTQGSILLNALMKQPIVPGSSLGLCHLLSSNSESLPGAVLQPNYVDMKSTQLPISRTTQEEMGPLVSLREAQKLAVTGLNLIALDEGLPEESLTGIQRESSPLTHCKIRGAVYLLPLVEHHLGAYCQAVQLADKSINSACGNHSSISSRTNTNMVSSKEDFRLSLEETTVISLGILYYLVFYSWDIVHTLLSTEVEKSSTDGVEQFSKMDHNVLCDNKCGNKEDTRTQGGLPVAPQDANNDQAQHSLFKKLLQVLAFSATRGSQADSILNQSLKALVKLAENSTIDLLINFQHLLSGQVLLHCLCPETPLPAVLLAVRLVSLLAQHHMLAAQLCSHSDTCLLLALYMYITSRPDKSASERLWLQLEQETVRLLTRCMQCPSPVALLPGTDCQCNLEVVKALIIMLHRQWMKMRRSENSLCAYKEQIIQFLRDTVLLLHSLSQKDKLFHEHCLEVLHQYDQAMPGVRAILKKTQKLSACEELILDELYPPEPEAEDQGMDSS